jgi:hypothetical protein
MAARATNRPLEVALLVLGEGRGHMTQALALTRYLSDAGHRVTHVDLGVSGLRPVPRYFEAGLPVRVCRHEAAMLATAPERTGISAGATARHNLRGLPRLVGDGFALADRLRAARVDVVVNLFDLVGALAARLRARGVPMMALGHNYLVDHPDVARHAQGGLGRLGLQALCRGTAPGTTPVLALSFDPLPSMGRLEVVPPLLRPELAQVRSRDDGSLLVYALNPGYARRIVAWQKTRPDVEVHCFVEGGGASLAGDTAALGPGMHLHALDGGHFLERLAGCRAYVGTAGFESLCEALWLGKPTLAIPVDGHYEQRFNAADATRAGAALAGGWHDIGAFFDHASAPSPQRVAAFRSWVAQAPELIVRRIERAAARAQGR